MRALKNAEIRLFHRPAESWRRPVPPTIRQNAFGILAVQGAGHDVHWARNEGVGEHVRIRFHADKDRG
jgi:hypothetical protein